MSHPIKHISFDAWNTLLIPNIRFAEQRTLMLSDAFKVDIDVAKEAYTHTKRFLDTIAEMNGSGLSCSNVYSMLNGWFKNTLSSDELNKLQTDIATLFIEFPPLILPKIIEHLHHLHHNDYTLGILSNTNFVSGTVLHQVFDNTFGDTFFASALYSDLEVMSKPNPNFFQAMVDDVTAFNHNQLNRTVQYQNICHIGDNLITDVYGATNIGIRALHTISPFTLVETLTGI